MVVMQAEFNDNLVCLTSPISRAKHFNEFISTEATHS